MSRYLSCFLLCLAPLAAAQVELGDWSLDYDTGRLGSLRYRGELVVSQSSLTGFLPEWKGTRFGLARQAPEVTRAADRLDLRFPIETPGHASGAVVVALTETEVSWRLEAQIEPTGPVEFGLYLPSATFCREDGSCALRLNGREVEYDSSTRPATNVSRLLLPRPGWDLVWSFNSTPGYWAFQDHRTTTAKAFRAIASATINAPTKLVAEARLKVIPAAPERVEARRATQAQRSRWTASVPLENTGFEAGGAGWALPANGAVEEGNAHGGERAARLTVKDPSTEAVYITRQVPITGGSYYQARASVRTQGVVRTEGKMASVGAGLILEWADKNGKWYAAGGYATELWGDKPWTVRETELLRAPEEAAYGVVFLALRGAGTAWFDDVELTEVHRALLLSDPAPGTTLADNTPRLVWAEDPRTMSYTVELSQDPAFPDASTQRLPSERAELEVPEPLAKGTWHWRVRAPGYEPGATWHFEQTADPAADTTAPRITATPVRVTSANEQVRVAVTDTAPGVKVSASLGETALTPRLSERDGRCEVGLQGPWALGLNRVGIAATDRAGNRAEATLLVLNRPKPARPVVINGAGAYEESGRPIFPFGIYQVSPAAMPTVKQAGFDVVHTYQFEGSQDDVAARAYLDAAAAAGLRVFLGFDRGAASGNGMVQGNTEHLIARVAALADHPGLFCWYLFDEPEITDQYIAPRTLNGYADLVRSLDPYHPVVMTTWGPRMALYRRSFDTHWTQAYTTPAGVVKQLDEHRRLLGPETPLTLLVHCYDRGHRSLTSAGAAPPERDFEPDPGWMRAAAFAGITQEVNGLWWWWYAETAKDWRTVADVPEAWAGLSRVVADLQELEPVLVDPTAAETGAVDVTGGQVRWWRKRVGQRTTLIVVNTSEQAVTAEVPAPGDGAVRQRGQAREATRRGGLLPVSLDRYAVQVYQW